MSIDDIPEEADALRSRGADPETRIAVLRDASELRDLLDIGLSPGQRGEHADALLDGLARPEEGSAVRLVHSLVRHVVGSQDLPTDDEASLAPAFPLTAHVLAQDPAEPSKRVDSVWDVSTPNGEMKVIDLPNGLELVDGGCIVARATPLQFTCSSLTRSGRPPAGYAGDFNILGRKGDPVPTPAAPPAPGQAPSGAAGQCLPGSVAGDAGGPGVPGAAGTKGTNGTRGVDGIPSCIATISITNAITLSGVPSLLVATQSGPGGDGGDGGPGGPGQQGGNGGQGATCDCTGNGGGDAGPGGAGGVGGDGGDGGNGVASDGNITVYLPAGVNTGIVQPLPITAPPGNGGRPAGRQRGGSCAGHPAQPLTAWTCALELTADAGLTPTANTAEPGSASADGQCIPFWDEERYASRMSVQIAIRLPDDMVAFLDQSVAAGNAPSRAALVARALEREMRRQAAERDAAILRAKGPADDLDDLVTWAASHSAVEE
ncbi:ribbon-helix-helix domain-containing protein [Raineyella fluvialis]|nr:hypothetical protein [Raineyella fluvialis]